MTLKITGLKQTRRMLSRVEKFLKSVEPMGDITEGVAEEILKKTSKGKDFSNTRFEEYSPAYAKKKGQLLVDLKASGLMLASLDSKVINANHGRVFIKPQGYAKTKARTDLIANIHTTGTGKQPKREFMNVSKSVMKKLQKKHYDDKIMKLLGRK